MYVCSLEGGGVLRLHATYRHDLKIKASDEGRVMKTAAAFAKGLLELEGQLTPILASLVTVEEKNSQMLDRGDNIEVKADMDQCKKRLDHIQVDAQMSEELIEKVAPECSATMRQMLYSLNNPLQCLKRMHELMKGIVAQLKDISEKGQAIQQQQILVKKQLQQRMNAADADASANVSLAQLTMSEEDTPPSVPSTPFQPHRRFLGTGLDSDQLETSVGELYLNEQFDLMYDRWKQIYGDFLSKKTGMFDLTKVPDVYDMVRYDVLHNIHLKLEGIEELYQLSKAFDSCVVPQEYGSDRLEKRYIGCKMCCALLEKIRKDIHVAMTNADDENAMLYRLDHTHAEDLQINSVHRAVRTRLYFTSESHMHTLLNVLHYPSDGQPPLLSEEGLQAIDDIPAVSYLSQIVLRVFEQTPTSYRCELSFSPGAIADPFSGEKTTVAPCGLLDSNVKVGQLIDHLEDAINLSRAGRKGSSAEVSTPGATPSINDDF